MKPTRDQLGTAIEAWNSWEQAGDPVQVRQALCQSWQILVAPGPLFFPIRRLIARMSGTSFEQKGGRNVNMQGLAEYMLAEGYGRVRHGSAYFEDLFEEYSKKCASLGGEPGAVKGPDPRIGREFWIAPVAP